MPNEFDQDVCAGFALIIGSSTHHIAVCVCTYFYWGHMWMWKQQKNKNKFCIYLILLWAVRDESPPKHVIIWYVYTVAMMNVNLERTGITFSIKKTNLRKKNMVLRQCRWFCFEIKVFGLAHVTHRCMWRFADWFLSTNENKALPCEPICCWLKTKTARIDGDFFCNLILNGVDYT